MRVIFTYQQTNRRKLRWLKLRRTKSVRTGQANWLNRILTRRTNRRSSWIQSANCHILFIHLCLLDFSFVQNWLSCLSPPIRPALCALETRETKLRLFKFQPKTYIARTHVRKIIRALLTDCRRRGNTGKIETVRSSSYQKWNCDFTYTDPRKETAARYIYREIARFFLKPCIVRQSTLSRRHSE